MTVSRKDFTEIAAIVAHHYAEAPTVEARLAAGRIAFDLAVLFKANNAAFRYSTFFTACGMPTAAAKLRA
jgi:hypothetical protein